MVSKSKLYSQLDLMERDLRERIIPHLEVAADGNNDLVFCVPDFNPYPELRSKTDPETQELVLLGRQILSMRDKLNEPSVGTIAERICWYCRKWSDVKEHCRMTAQGLANAFLKEIRNSKQ